MPEPPNALPDGHRAVATADAAAYFTGRAGGVSTGEFAALNVGDGTGDDPAAVAENQRRLAALAGPDHARRTLVLARQVHGAAVAVHRAGEPLASTDDVDAQVTDRRDLTRAVRTADCVPVALLASWGAGVAHAGWRGLAAGVLPAAVDALVALAPPGGSASDVVAAIGPAAGPCCYEVGDEVRGALGASGPGPTVDLGAVAARQLAAAGLRDVRDVGACTICGPAWFSYRRARGSTGRQAGLAWRT